VRKRTYAEVPCAGRLSKINNNKYECSTDAGTYEIDLTKKTYFRTVTVNRRTGVVAFDNEMVGECRVADFDTWECTERVPSRGGPKEYDSIQHRSGLSGGGYLEEWCSVKPDAPAVRSLENCYNQRYYGIPVSPW
jgi:hypothetical protein